MSDITDKVKHQAEELKGKAKEGLGKLTGDEEMVGEGQREQAESKVGQFGDKVSDKVEDATDRLRGLTGNSEEERR